MRQLFRFLLPYCLGHKRNYVIGAVVIFLSNFLFVQSFVWVGNAIDYVLGPNSSFVGAFHYIAVIMGLVLVGAVAQYFQRIFLIGSSRKIEYEMRNDFFAHLTRLSPAFYDRMKTGDIVSRATDDINLIRLALGPGIMYPLNTLCVVPITLVEMVSKSWAVTFYCFLPMISLPILVNILANIMYKRSLRIQEHYADFSGRIQESISGIRVIKSFVREDRERDLLEEMNRKNARFNLDLAKVQACFHPTLIMLFNLGIIVIVWVSSKYIVADPTTETAGRAVMTKGDLISYVLLYRNLFFPVLGLGWIVSIYQRASASVHRIRLILDQKPAITDTETVDHALDEISGNIEFRNLTFSYPGSDRPALRDISVRIAAGQTLGIVGPVGSGKSTLGQVLTRLYDPPRGSVYLDGRDVHDYPLDVLRQSIGMVFQETYLFSETIASNIAFAPRAASNEVEVRGAASLACVDPDIRELPKGYETMLGERGINLSGGQKQRLALARAILSDPSVLVLDDAFASVDTQTEERILHNLRDVIESRTTLLVSHRISTVKQADHIIVLDDGAIAEEGSHESLLEQGGLYAEIHQRQLLEEEIALEE